MKLSDLKITSLIEDDQSLEDTSEPKVLGRAGQFTLTVDENDEQVTLSDDRGKTVVQMPLVIWKQLARL